MISEQSEANWPHVMGPYSWPYHHGDNKLISPATTDLVDADTLIVMYNYLESILMANTLYVITTNLTVSKVSNTVQTRQFKMHSFLLSIQNI